MAEPRYVDEPFHDLRIFTRVKAEVLTCGGKAPLFESMYSCSAFFCGAPIWSIAPRLSQSSHTQSSHDVSSPSIEGVVIVELVGGETAVLKVDRDVLHLHVVKQRQ